jgi:hypothetical protein
LHQQSASNIYKSKKPPAHTEIGICFFGEIAIIMAKLLNDQGGKWCFHEIMGYVMGYQRSGLTMLEVSTVLHLWDDVAAFFRVSHSISKKTVPIADSHDVRA